MKTRLAQAFHFCSALLLITIMQSGLAQAQLTELFAFQYNPAATSNFPKGETPMAELIQGSDGNYYTTTNTGGSGTCPGVVEDQIPGCGAVVKITRAGALSVLYSFPYDKTTTSAPKGWNVQAGLVQAKDGNFYGVASIGGATSPACGSGCGTVFKITPKGILTLLHSFCGMIACGSLPIDGSAPVARLAIGANGQLYGTTSAGGSANGGVIFSVSTSGGGYKVLHQFTGSSGDGDGWVSVAGLILGTDGSFYGTTEYGGSGGLDKGEGTVFKMTSTGMVTILHSFVGNELSSPDGAYPKGALVEATDGNLYGTCSSGGVNGRGTAFRISTKGVFKKIYDFEDETTAGNIGSDPLAGLIQASDGNLYGTAWEGGAFTTTGTIYQLTLNGVGKLKTSFVGDTTGFSPLAEVLQGSDGRLYVTLQDDGGENSGGVQDQGAISVLNAGLAAPKAKIVSFFPTSATPGTVVTLRGADFVGTTAVKFNGTSAVWVVDSSGFLTVTVPATATTGTISVTNAGGTTTTTTIFTVL